MKIARVLSPLTFVALAVLGAACEENERPPQIPLAAMPKSGCTDVQGQAIERVCLPRMARESIPLTLEIEGACGSCGTRVEHCRVTVDAHDVTLSLDGKSCVASSTCAEPCGHRRVTCTLPRLDSGRYRVHWGDASGRVDTLEVSAGNGDSRCSFDQGQTGG